MSRELAGLLQSRARLEVMGWPRGLGLSLGLHLLVAAAIFVASRPRAVEEEGRRVTWVTLPAVSGVAGGSGAQALGESGERVRRVEEVASQATESGRGRPTPQGLQEGGTRKPVGGTNPDASSRGQARDFSRGSQVDPNASRGAGGGGAGGGVGQGSGVPGLQNSGGAVGGVGMIGDLDSSFPFAWYLQQVQNRIAANWYRPAGVQGRVLIYFRIRPDGTLDAIRRDTPSPNAALNDSAEQAVRRSSPMPPLPQGFDGKYLGIWFWFTSN